MRNMFCRIISRVGSARSTRVHGLRSGGTEIQVTVPGAVPAPGTAPAGARVGQIAVRDRITAPGMVDPVEQVRITAQGMAAAGTSGAEDPAAIRETEDPAGQVRVTEAAAPAADRFRTGGIRSGGAVRPGIRRRIGLRGASMIPRMGHIGAGDIRVM